MRTPHSGPRSAIPGFRGCIVTDVVLYVALDELEEQQQAALLAEADGAGFAVDELYGSLGAESPVETVLSTVLGAMIKKLVEDWGRRSRRQAGGPACPVVSPQGQRGRDRGQGDTDHLRLGSGRQKGYQARDRGHARRWRLTPPGHRRNRVPLGRGGAAMVRRTGVRHLTAAGHVPPPVTRALSRNLPDRRPFDG